MRLIGFISNYITKSRSVKPEVRLRVRNLTRQTELAHSVGVANRVAKRMKGLLGRGPLSIGEGLWLIPCGAIHTFGMKFPIDLVYLDRNHRVEKIKSSVPPGRVSACLRAHSVLELASGSIYSTQTQSGDVLDFSPTVIRRIYQ